MNGVVLISMEMFLAMVFFHFHKVAYGAIVEEYGMLNWLKLRYVGSFVWNHWLLKKNLNMFSTSNVKVKILATLPTLEVKKSSYTWN